MSNVKKSKGSSLSSVVSNLVRASMGNSLASTVNDEDLDKHVAELILKEAKKKAERYATEGYKAFLPTADVNAPRTNKRFLNNIIKSTDDHNRTVLRAQAEAAQEIKRQRDELEREERRVRAEEAVAARKATQSSRSGGSRESESRRGERKKRKWEELGEECDYGGSREHGSGDYDHEEDKGRNRRRRDHLSGHRRDDYEERYFRRRRARSRSPAGISVGERKGGDRRRRSQRNGRSRSTDRRNDNQREDYDEREQRSRPHSGRHHSHTRSRSGSCERTNRNADFKEREGGSKGERTSTPVEKEDERTDKSQKRTTKIKSTSRSPSPAKKVEYHSELTCTAHSQHETRPGGPTSSPTASPHPVSHPLPPSPPLPPIPRPPRQDVQSSKPPQTRSKPTNQPPPPSGSPPLPPPLPSKMDRYFEESYDPRLDVAPLVLPSIPATGLINNADFEGWDAMLEVLKARREEKVERKRLERLGLVEKKGKKGKSNAKASAEVSEVSVMDIAYKKRGSVREWDLGKEGFS